MSGTASSAGERVLRTDHAGSRLGGCPPRLVGLLAFLLAGALIGGLIWRQEQQRLREARSQAASVAAERAHDIRTSVEGALAPTYALAAMLQPGRQGIPAFAAACDRLLRHFPSVSALQLAPGGVVRQVVPLAGNESLIGVDLLHDPDLGWSARYSRNSGMPLLTGPFRLAGGGLEVVGLLPTFADDLTHGRTFWGFAVARMPLREVLRQSRLDDLEEQGYAYQLFRRDPETREKALLAASPRADLVDPVEKELVVANATWSLSVAPVAGWADARGLLLQVAAGLLFCLVLAWQAAWQARLVAASRAHERTLELRVAQRTADLQRFAEVTAHHLQEPARRVATYAGRLRSQLAGRVNDPEAQLSLDFIGQQAGRLQELLRDAELYLSADQPRGQIECCSVEAVLQSVLTKLAGPIAEAGARLSIGHLPPALIDLPRLGDLFRVAIENALQHGRGTQALRIDVSGERSGEWVIYHVSDNGPGVEEEYRGRVFRVFERLSSSGEGTGVGLAIVRRVAESCGGQAWIEEAPGGGCRLALQLPAAEPPAGVGGVT
ncbi:MAG TPA: ATP-binding protein [Accumulibacter sp.]|uniref:sensor histidine kinase n=1 Tax=Accumulibacter sp. TaxID=2053492 RepID=UPI002C8C973F|nr:ATP-binding protein [Accumulibacter sp.]HRD88543.1 ATP-binding protein [Accumulibacter sp.]